MNPFVSGGTIDIIFTSVTAEEADLGDDKETSDGITWEKICN